jgi:hypothetical protein
MPKLTEDSADRYPMFEKWMRQDFVHVISNPRIMKAFFKWSNFSAGDSPASRLYFNYGMPPMIGLMTTDCDYNDDGTPSGLLWAKTRSAAEIGLNTLILDEFEKLLNSRANPFIPKNLIAPQFAELEKAVENTILHEMVHWSYRATGNDNEEKNYGGDPEYGTDLFELEAYGYHPIVSRDHFCQRKVFAFLGIAAPEEIVLKADRSGSIKILKVTAVAPNSPAAAAGFQPGNIIDRFDGSIIWAEGFTKQLRKKKPGDKVLIEGTITRGSQTRFNRSVTLGSSPQ